MAKPKKKRRRKDKRQPSGEAQSMSAGVKRTANKDAKPSDVAGKVRYTTDKLLRFIKRADRHDEARALLDTLWPTDAEHPAPRIDRTTWLLGHWPEQALTELGQHSSFDERLLVLLSESVLALGDDHVAQAASLRAVPESWPAEARAVRRASQSLASGDDNQAAAELKAIGLRSPFRNVRLFLRGLQAYYCRDDAQARKALSAIHETSPLACSAGRIAASCVEGTSGHGEPAAAKPLGQSSLAAVATALQERRPNAALQLATEAAQSLSLVDQEGLLRDLASALLHFGNSPAKVLDKVGRAFPSYVTPARRSHLQALISAAASNKPAGHSERSWESLAGHLAAGRCDIKGDAADLARADVLGRRGVELIAAAREERESLPFFFFESRDSWFDAEDMLEDATDLLEQAVELDPGQVTFWAALQSVHRLTDDTSEAYRVIDRMAKALPNHPEALTMAARAAAEREAWDKGMRYARQAVSLEPLNRDARDLEAWLRLGKARKKLRQGDTAGATTAYEGAMAVPYRTRDSQLKVSAELMAHFEATGKSDAAREIQDSALAADPRRWLWAGYVLLGYEHVGASHFRSKRAKRGRRPTKRDVRRNTFAPTQDLAHSVADAPLAPTELNSLLDLQEGAEKHFDRKCAKISELVVQAIAAGIPEVTDRKLVERCLRSAYESPEVALAVAERGVVLFNEPAYVGARYDFAMQVGKPREYFATARDDLRKALERASKDKQTDLDDFDDLDDHLDELGPLGGLLRQEMGLSSLTNKLKMLLRRLDHYVGRQSKSRKKSRNQQTMLPF